MPDNAPTKAEQMKQFMTLVDDMQLGMLITQSEDGSLVSRAMATQKRRPGIDLWFVTSTETHKVAELEANPEVNVSFLNPGTREWVSIAGTATVNTDRNLIRELYQPDWKIWFQDGGGNDANSHGSTSNSSSDKSSSASGNTKDSSAGGPDDPRIVLIDIDAHTVDYFKSNDSRPVALFKVAKAFATGKAPSFGDTQHIDK